MKVFITALLLMLTLFALPAAAQEQTAPAYVAWLYDAPTGNVTAVGSDGIVVQEFTLPLAQAFNAYGPSIAVSPSGTHIVYIGVDSAASVPNRSVFVYDIALTSLVASYQLAPEEEATNIELGPTPTMFDEATKRVAIGTIFFDRASADSTPEWKVVILNYQLGTVESTLSSTNANAVDAVGENSLVLPVVRRFVDNQVTFMTVYYATGGAPEYPAFTWDIATGELIPDDVFTIFNSDILAATGEIISPAFDESLPMTSIQPMGPVPIFNIVRVYDPAVGSTSPFYNESEEIINSAYFAQNGERVMISSYTDETGISWTLVERDGTIVAEPELPDSAYVIWNTPDGFLYAEPPASAEEGTRVVHFDTRSGSMTPTVIYSTPAQQYPFVAYVQINAPASESYGAWAQLGG